MFIFDESNAPKEQPAATPEPPSSAGASQTGHSSPIEKGGDGVGMICHSMHWMWKLTFVVAAIFSLPLLIQELASYRISSEDLFISFVPVATWLTVRWLYVGSLIRNGLQ